MSFVSVVVLPRKGVQKLRVDGTQPLKDVLRGTIATRLQPGEELMPMWDPATNQYKDPLAIDTPVRKMRKPVRVLARIGRLPIQNIQDIEQRWPYAINQIKRIGRGMWEVHSRDALEHIVVRGTQYPIERAYPKPQHVRLGDAVHRRPRRA